MKKILYIMIYLFTLLSSKISFATNNDIKDKLLDDTSSNIGNVSGTTTSSILGGLFAWFKTEIFSVIMVISIAVFIYIGIKFSTSKGNPEEFKKAWLHLIYAVIGIFFVFMAWGLVKIVSSLSL
ncbi:MAG: hypothetical protein PHV23_05685 [Candidatus Gracilibacteria bacterium]|nr:hypothetical protein [Candidatus Gracilibacteria bacterium]